MKRAQNHLEADPYDNAEARARKRSNRAPTEFPVRLIPVVVPALAVLLASVVYLLMGEIL